MVSCLIIAVFLTLFIFIHCDEPSTELDDVSSLPLLVSGKRQHNIMRFGKRPSAGHNLIHFGKRGEPQHRFLFMGKRENKVPDLFPFTEGGDNSYYKRGHNIMRFGKRTMPKDSRNVIPFEKKDEEEEKRTPGHSMMYFGKRADGHNMMYFGKRGGPSMMYFGERDIGLGNEEPGIILIPEENDEKSMIHFGKREEDFEEDSKRGDSHSMIHFGKRPSVEDKMSENEFIRSPEAIDNRNFERLGKKMEGVRTSHAMIHFGKRSMVGNRTKRAVEEVSSPLVWDPNYLEYDDPEKKDGSKNVFLRFG